MLVIYQNLLFCILFCFVLAAPQNPEINDQFSSTTKNTTETETTSAETTEKTTVDSDTEHKETTKKQKHVNVDEIKVTTKVVRKTKNRKPKAIREDTSIESETKLETGFLTRIYTLVTHPIMNLVSIPKVKSVLRNVGTCLVNGVMELISHYLPAPFIPLVASAAGMLIPFEPVVMLRDKMPVASYRRAFKSAVNSFLGTFDQYKLDDANYDDDPYMTMRFNRRMMNIKPGE